ncbi:Predicted transcriptional regulator YheO, contains PAS and DNA-binding HTH domains [Dethiosulfatibacter aminovorans DSM 17477]|uniref:Predicted transcriptional regulator YheO, contains PAS and DNA-binding HTH domains n=1 Tax=Dethiosulfatibacter aminovorans DSM 17477 TaxID=1121476 RepID=A0A1M6HB81_9FIRM|nr:PAS domain-containing protein [Dethiosulfatibacter aminovorans]SHJ19383.1 Predicted transcriptional regulator YheO, contains PAS and DNA-binding HTH domains [Dethiosulfatibacter aminovorans DSM 17477]
MKDIFKKYIVIGEFISQVMGDNSEVVIHDISSPESSIIWIDKSHISGRKVGDSFTDLSLMILNEKEYEEKNYIVNYEGKGKGGRKFISSTYFIKDDEGTLQGFLCINNDVTDYLEFKEQFGKLEKYFSKTTSDYQEEISAPVSSFSESIIQDVLKTQNISISRMKKKEKIEVVRQMQEKGLFDIKGGASEAARSLEISEPTLYRYLKELS